jgi:hypothetical protein
MTLFRALERDEVEGEDLNRRSVQNERLCACVCGGHAVDVCVGSQVWMIQFLLPPLCQSAVIHSRSQITSLHAQRPIEPDFPSPNSYPPLPPVRQRLPSYSYPQHLTRALQ